MTFALLAFASWWAIGLAGWGAWNIALKCEYGQWSGVSWAYSLMGLWFALATIYQLISWAPDEMIPLANT